MNASGRLLRSARNARIRQMTASAAPKGDGSAGPRERGAAAMRVAALYDIHGNLPALQAVLDDVHHAAVDQLVIGGDVIPGPLPRETLARLLDLPIPVQFI